MPNRDKTKLSSIEVRSSPIQGRGVFATSPIRKGTRIIEYRGKRISSDEADDRYGDDPAEHPHVLLFETDGGEYIDGGRGGNDARFINHSCDPNCEVVDESGRIFIEALRSIKVGEELTYDYSLQVEERHTRATRDRYRCGCSSKRCRGTMLELRTKPRARNKSITPSKKRKR